PAPGAAGRNVREAALASGSYPKGASRSSWRTRSGERFDGGRADLLQDLLRSPLQQVGRQTPAGLLRVPGRGLDAPADQGPPVQGSHESVEPQQLAFGPGQGPDGDLTAALQLAEEGPL